MDDTRMSTVDVDASLNRLTFKIIGAALDLQHELGVGLLEKTYRVILADELRHRGMRVVEEVRVPVHFRGRVIDQALRLDLLVEDLIVVELKAQSHLGYVDQAQLLTYLRMTGCELGLLLNFNQLPLGIKRCVLTPASSASSASSAAEGRVPTEEPGQEGPKPSSHAPDSPA